MTIAGLRRLVGRTVRNAVSDMRFARQRRVHRRRGSRQTVLVVDQLAPDPRLGAGYPRAFAILNELVAVGCQVAFYATEGSGADMARMRPAFGGQVHFFPPAGAEGLQRVLRTHGASFDLLFVSRPAPMTALAEGNWRPAAAGPVLVYDAEAVLSPREERRRALFGGVADELAGAEAEAELAPARVADGVTAVGPADAAVIGAAIGKPVVILSHLVAPRPSAPGFAPRRDILFVGRMTGARDRSPNVDSVVWFATEVMPFLDRLIGADYRFHLVGVLEAPEIKALLSDRVVSHGIVDDLTAVYDRSRVFVAPTRYAAGIPLKLVEAMAQGIAGVATPLLAEQLGAGADALPTGASAEAFARECARLYGDETAWAAVRRAALQHVGRHYSPAAFRSSVEQLLAMGR